MQKAADVFEQEFLDMRAKMLILAASFDRIDRAEGSAEGDSRLDALQEALDILRAPGPGRAEKIQHLFSLPYHASWRDEFGLAPR